MSLDYITLGDLQLNRNIRLRGALGNNTVVSQITRPAEGDNVNIMQWRTGTPDRQPGRKLALDGGGGLGRFTVAEIRAIELLQSLGQPVFLEHHVFNGMVLITGIVLRGLPIDYSDYDTNIRCDAQIDLIEV